MSFKIYSKPGCSYCEAAKTLLKARGLQYFEFVIGQDITKEELLEQVPNARTVPQIFYGNEYIGGYSQLVERLENGTGIANSLLLG